MTRYYLGPHHDFEEPRSWVSRAVAHMKRAFATPRRVSFTIVLIASLSFAVNLAFIALGATSTFWGPQVDLSIGASEDSKEIEEGLGSDEGVNIKENVSYYFAEDAPEAKATSEAYIVADADTGKIILEKNADVRLPIASVSKIMTAMVAKDNIPVRTMATVSESSYDTYGSEGGLGAGEKILVGDLFYPLLLESSNDAAEVMAEVFGHESFMALLNQKALALGMENTFFEDPSGLSPNNVSTASDLLRLGLHFKLYYPELLNVTRVKEYEIVGHAWENKNKFLTYPNFLGGKNGFIAESKQTSVSFFSVYFRSDKEELAAKLRNVVVIVLKSKDRDVDTAELLTHITKYARYELSR